MLNQRYGIILLSCGHFANASHDTGVKTISCPHKDCDTLADVKAITTTHYVVSEHAPSLF